MAGDWIKLRSDLWSDPRVVRIQLQTQLPRPFVLGALARIWFLADTHTVDGRLEHMTPEALDMDLGVEGFAEAVAAVGWLEVGDGYLQIPEFEAHNGQSAKRRALEAKRKSGGRQGGSVRTASAPRPQSVRIDADGLRTPCGAREEKRREDKEEDPPYPPTGGEGADAPGRASGGPPRAAKAGGSARWTKQAALDFPMPPDLEPLRAFWVSDWIPHVWARKKPTETAVAGWVKKLAKLGPQRARSLLESCRDNNAQGIPPWAYDQARNKASPTGRPMTTREANAETARKAKERLERQLLEELEPYPESQQIGP